MGELETERAVLCREMRLSVLFARVARAASGTGEFNSIYCDEIKSEKHKVPLAFFDGHSESKSELCHRGVMLGVLLHVPDLWGRQLAA